MKKGESKDDIDARNLALIQKLIELENIWKKSQENSRPRRQSTCSVASYSTTTTAAASFDHLLLQTSPRTLMSSLQQRNPAFRNKNCSNAVEEILMDRRATIMSGRFKGRQLFAAAETPTSEESESSLSHSYSGGGDTCSDWANEIDQEREVVPNYVGCGDRNELSSNFSEYCPLPEEKTVVEAAEKRGGDGRREEKGGGRRVATVGLGAVLIVLAFVFCCLSCHGNNVEEFILVPT